MSEKDNIFLLWCFEVEGGGAGGMGLIIIEEWREVNDDSFFKLVFDKNKKELKSGQLGRMKSFTNRERSR